MDRTFDLVVLSKVLPQSLKYEGDEPILDEKDLKKDDMDLFNHPRRRRAHILAAMLVQVQENENLSIEFEALTDNNESSPKEFLNKVYGTVHSTRMIEFLVEAWDDWKCLGDEGRDPSAFLELDGGKKDSNFDIPSLIPCCFPLPRDSHQAPSRNIHGRVSFYNTDTVTPIFGDLLKEILDDSVLVPRAVEYVLRTSEEPVVFVIPTHPGHHAAYDSFGGYCYLNHAAACANQLREKIGEHTINPIIAVLDIDYHCGNGTASIFYSDPTVLVVSIHCHPDYDYPFHTGFSNQTGIKEGLGTTLHLPLLPGTTWTNGYKQALIQALARINEFQANALVVSMGLDTYENDPCAMRRAGLCLKDDDYIEMGRTIAAGLSKSLPTIFIQEGGYRMDKVGKAAVDVVTTYAETRRSLSR